MIDGLLGYSYPSSSRIQFLSAQKWRNAFSLLFTRNRDASGDITPFEALALSMATSVGTGCIVGVAMAITLGGPGAVFWMLVTAFLGTATKYAEALLATKYRIINSQGEVSGGPMYYIERGLKDQYGGSWTWLSWTFALFGVISSLCMGNMIQSNAIMQSFQTTSMFPIDVLSAMFTAFVGLIILGGIESISKVTAKIVPVMLLIYVSCSLFILVKNLAFVPSAFFMIIGQAFTAKAIGGGFVGTVLRHGVARGILANQAGFGISSVAHAASTNDDPIMQGLINTFGSLLGTLVICLMTALVILVSGIIHFDPSTGLMSIPYFYRGAMLTTQAYNMTLPGIGGTMMQMMLLFFGITTMTGWYYYGSKCLEYMFGTKALTGYKWSWIFLCFVGTLGSVEVIWKISDIFLGLMAIPNLIALLALTPLIFAMTRDYEHVQDRRSA